MPDRIIIRSLPDGARWKVTQDDKTVARYPNQAIARAAARLARAESRKGDGVRVVLHKSDGSPKGERNYAKVQGAWFGNGNQDGTAGHPNLHEHSCCRLEPLITAP